MASFGGEMRKAVRETLGVRRYCPLFRQGAGPGLPGLHPRARTEAAARRALVVPDREKVEEVKAKRLRRTSLYVPGTTHACLPTRRSTGRTASFWTLRTAFRFREGCGEDTRQECPQGCALPGRGGHGEGQLPFHPSAGTILRRSSPSRRVKSHPAAEVRMCRRRPGGRRPS